MKLARDKMTPRPAFGGNPRQTDRPYVFTFVVAGLCLILGACGTRAWNAPIGAPDMKTDYVFSNRMPAENSKNLFTVLAFSGGGVRSAAFSYGILETLRDTRITIGGRERRLLDEVDVITSVSGGSFTAAYYGLFGDRVFRDFETRFLKRDVQGELIGYVLNPFRLASLVASDYNRSDLAAEWFGNELFDNRTFKDMSLGPLPYLIINASDLNTGTTFSFIQQQFDFLCSDISGYPVANAVTASSAMPGLFGPIAVRNYEQDCPQRRDSWVKGALRSRDFKSREYQVARALSRYLKPKSMPMVRLVDGGVTDNLGVRGSMMSPVAHYGNVPEMSGAFDKAALRQVRDVLVIIANAQAYADYDWSREGEEPGVISTLSASFDAALGLLNTETASLAENGFRMWASHVNRLRGAERAPVNLYFATLTFDQITKQSEREYFNAMPTNLSLAPDQIDRVRGLARRLLGVSPEFRKFMAKYQTAPPAHDR